MSRLRLHRNLIVAFCCGWLQLGLGVAARAAQTGDAPALVTNAGDTELSTIRGLFAALDRSVVARDATALRFYGVVTFPADLQVLRVQSKLTHIAVSQTGALVRQTYEVTGAADAKAEPVTLSSGTRDLWLARQADGAFAFTPQRWPTPDDAVGALVDAADEEWQGLDKSGVTSHASISAALGPAAGNAVAANPAPTMDPNGVLLHLVAAQRGGRWIALRRSRWNGALVDRARLTQIAENNAANGAGEDNLGEWVTRQMARFPADHAGIVHFLFQRGAHGWVGLGAVAEPNPHLDLAVESAASTWRQQIYGESYLTAAAHRDFGVALGKVNLYAEAADEFEKAAALAPGIVSTAALHQMREARPRDLQVLAARQIEAEANLGPGPEHPAYIIRALLNAINQSPAQNTPLNALRIGLEYSKLADDAQAATWLATAQQMIDNGALKGVNPNDAGWINVLHDHLQDRRRLAPLKPPTILRSALFTVRCWPNDLNALKLLAALEEAQHTVYADFGVPMGSTEIVLWRNQREFQDYTSKFSDQAISEFVAALTLTKLITTQDGPVVLGEEVNVFIDPRADPFSTVAHEYGHVAVRHVSRGRFVPVWFNEGIACAVEGGYDGYLPRVRRAARAGQLIGMPDMEQWDVDGERAFLAYSQANSIIDYIIARTPGGRASILEILRQIGRDVPPDNAFRSVLGVSQEQLWAAWARDGVL